jgi:hypothetical protein
MPKPLLFGDATFDADRMEEFMDLDTQWDRSYVPGYSELRRNNELAALPNSTLKHIPIPARLQWVRISRTGGEDVDRKDLLEFGRLGYQFVMADSNDKGGYLRSSKDLTQYNYGFPPTAYVSNDGLIRREDLALAIVDGDRAQINIEARERRRGHTAPAVGDRTGEEFSVEESHTESGLGVSSLRKLLDKD